MAEDDQEAQWRGQVRQVLQELPEGFLESRTWLAEINQGFREEMARAVQGRLNAYLQTQPSQSYADKQAIASFVNHELGLAIRCPKTGLPSILVADIKDADHPDVSRFRLETRVAAGPKRRTWASSHLIQGLEIMPAPARHEGLARRQTRVEGVGL